MEHRIITGGAHYLPFARHRVRQLRGQGLQWVTERYDFGDGQVEIRLKGEIEYIKLEGGGCTLRMDSGVVAMHNSDPEIESEVRFTAGTLHEADSQRVYNADFVASGETSWRTKKGPGQVSGDVTGGRDDRFRGRVPQDGVTARSFAPKSVRVGEEIKADERDNDLVAKKIVVTKCPASIFTGRCRLYVQSMYGLHTTTDATDGAGTVLSIGEVVPFPVRLANTYGQPSLYVQAYRAPGEPSPGEAWLGTGTGVHLDTATGRHWLLNPNATSVTVMPLKGSACAEALRRYLKDGTETALTAEDKEHLEAYILSTCRPVVQDVQTIAIAETPMYSMGYGWHWDWQGLKADIVVNETREMPFEGGFNREGMRSTHYRLTASLNEDGAWSASAGVLEGPVDWSVNRGLWCIAEPNWVFHRQEKSTPRYSSYSACDAPFYVFYVRDVIQVCRVRVELIPAQAGVREVDPPYFALTPYGQGMARLTAGLHSGFGKDTDAVAAYYAATFTCGEVSFSGLRAGYVATASKIEISGKAQMPVGYVGHYNDVWGTNTQDIGYPSWTPTGGFVWPQMTIYQGATQAQTGPRVQFDEIETRESENSSSLATMIVPFDDAEALFFQAERAIQHTRVSGARRRLEDGGFAYCFRIDTAILDSDGLRVGWSYGATNYIQYRATNGASGGTTIIEDWTNLDQITWRSDEASVRKFIGHAGAVDARMDDLYYYHDPEDFCSPSYSAKSGSRVEQPVAISAAQIVPVGTSEDGANATIVGWA